MTKKCAESVKEKDLQKEYGDYIAAQDNTYLLTPPQDVPECPNLYQTFFGYRLIEKAVQLSSGIGAVQHTTFHKLFVADLISPPEYNDMPDFSHDRDHFYRWESLMKDNDQFNKRMAYLKERGIYYIKDINIDTLVKKIIHIS